jgi:hypothetical protein
MNQGEPSAAAATLHSSIVLFLDVDGVLNQCGYQQDVLTAKARLLHRIVTETGCSVVVSSTWRQREERRRLLVKLLQENGVSIADWTPCLDAISDTGLYLMQGRADEIQAWLEVHPEVTRFAILDDLADMAHLGAHLVQTDSFIGLTEALAEEVIRRLK